MTPQDLEFMQEALALAKIAAELGEVPVGAVLVHEGKIVGKGYNRREIDSDPLAHAEMIAIKQASLSLARWRLAGCTMYVTLEPCPMCAGALVNARVEKLIYAAKDPKSGAVNSLMSLCSDPRLNHRVQIESGVLSEESSSILKAFFQKLRK